MKKRREKALVILIIVGLLLTLVACGGNAKTQNDNTPMEINEHETLKEGTMGALFDQGGINFANIENLYFGTYKDYDGFNKEDGIPIDVAESGDIALFVKGNDGYILSDNLILMNPNSDSLFDILYDDEEHKLQTITFNNVSTAYVINMRGMFNGCENRLFWHRCGSVTPTFPYAA